MEQPNYKHDCDHCEFLGEFIHHGKPVDLYICENHGQREFIGRYSSEGSDYACTSFINDEPVRINRVMSGIRLEEPQCKILYGWVTDHAILRWAAKNNRMESIIVQ